MPTAVEVQTLLRFLTQDAKVPLSLAMSKITEMQKASLNSPSSLATTDLKSLQAIFPDEKTAKQILNAAKRVSKKRTLGAADDDPQPSSSSSPNKRKKPLAGSSPEDPLLDPAAIEASLALPSTHATDEELKEIVLRTNRAPLVLAFAVVLLRYTMPEQPLSSRLSLAQAVVSANSRSKAVSIGLEKGKSAEEDGWGQGQPQVRVMGRDIRVMKRWGYEWKEEEEDSYKESHAAAEVVDDSQETIKADESLPLKTSDNSKTEEIPPALWGLDLEALRSSNEGQGQSVGFRPIHQKKAPSNLPIYTPQSARSYLLKSFTTSTTTTAPSSSSSPTTTTTKKKKTSPRSTLKSSNEHNLALLLSALDKLHASWAPVLSAQELDRRSWTWYVAVRPEVQQGEKGWGEKGEVKLGGILELRRRGGGG